MDLQVPGSSDSLSRTFTVVEADLEKDNTRPDFDQLIYDIALLHSLGVKLVLVHGARPQVDSELSARDITSDYVDNLRVTDGPTLDCVMAAVGRVRMEIEAALSTSLASTSMGGARLKVASGNWITGKPVGMGGSLGRTEATGYGVIYTVREALKKHGLTVEGTTASVQGFGNVAQYAIQLFTRLGGKVVAVSSWDQADQASYTFRRESGVDFDELRGITRRPGILASTLISSSAMPSQR